MQQVVLAWYAYKLTGSAAFVGLLGFAQLGPVLLLSIVGGLLADLVDRRKWLMGMQAASGALPLAPAFAAPHHPQPPRAVLFFVVMGIGIANALNAPAWSVVLP